MARRQTLPERKPQGIRPIFRSFSSAKGFCMRFKPQEQQLRYQRMRDTLRYSRIATRSGGPRIVGHCYATVPAIRLG
jgi:hypothetical protein